jgi:hypothetical protein
MGCHTWFYNLSELDNWDKIKEKAYEYLKQMKDRTDDYHKQHDQMMRYCIDNKLDTIVGEFVSAFGNLSTYHNEKIYTKVEGLYDLFRIGGYPEDKLLSYDETLEYMKKYCEKYKVPFESHFGNIEEIKDELLQFWNQYPNGLIEFG